MPDVLRHQLANMPALAAVNVLLTLRFVPVPYVSEDTRFLVRRSDHLAAVYRVVVRVGYFERVDHGPAFVRQLVGCLIKYVAAHAHQSGADALPVPQAAPPLANTRVNGESSKSSVRATVVLGHAQQDWTSVAMTVEDAEVLVTDGAFASMTHAQLGLPSCQAAYPLTCRCYTG
jgi:hypothetical protein